MTYPGKCLSTATASSTGLHTYLSQHQAPILDEEQALQRQMLDVPLQPFRLIEITDLWQLMFMERDKIGQGKNAYETEEPGYVKSVMKGYQFMLSTIGHPLTPELYEQLHDNCVEGISTDEYPRGIPKGFRQYADGAEAFGLEWGTTVSQAGVEELKGRIKTYSVTDGQDQLQFLKTAMQSPDSTILRIGPAEKPMIKLKPTRPETCKLAVGQCIQYYLNAPKQTEDEKLLAIAAICQDLDQLHVFVDGNIRTTGILLMNKLLIENDLSPTVMHDVNQLDCLSRAEIVDLIKEGQQFFNSLKKT